jgi:hypothetical protein
MQHAHPQALRVEQVTVPAPTLGLAPKAMVLGLVAIAVALLLDVIGGPKGLYHFAHAYLLGYFFVLTIALGGLIFVCLQRLVKAGWSVVVRRVAEVVAGTMPALAILFLPIVFMMHQLYPWTHEELVANDAILLGKRAYLNTPFFLIRAAIYFAVWIWVSRTMLRLSLRQDETGDIELTRKTERMSAPAVILFALTITFAAFDFLMSLDPHWFSTIFGVYVFAGSMIAFVSTAILVVKFLQSRGVLRDVVTVEHFHDLGKILFGFTMFWGYIAFSQFLLIWYANIPEETIWYEHRLRHGWHIISYALLFGHFVVPFCGLLSRHIKRDDRALVFWAAWQLTFHAVDLYWLVMPALTTPHGSSPAVHESFPLHVMDVLALGGFAALFLGLVLRSMRGINLVPVKDPRLPEARAHHNF